MSKPEDIPQSVWETGLKMAGEYVQWLAAGNSTGDLSHHAELAMADTISRAIMAEREECAEVVRKVIPSMPADGPVNTEHEAEYMALGSAMMAIRNRP